MTTVADPFTIQNTGEAQDVPIVTAQEAAQAAQEEAQPVLEVSVPGGTTAGVVAAGGAQAAAPAPTAGTGSIAGGATDPIPRFEGAQVLGTATKLTGTHTLDGEETLVLTMDDRVRLIGEYRVIKVGFETNSNGDLIRVQTLKALEVERCPYDPSDPNDDGIWRSRPVQP